ncbi:MAG: hypothetical protein K6G19_08770, partial [Lachnospiraceae bacterium]|nr:hypothetical protein [Lachnospiraceae bacterium]
VRQEFVSEYDDIIVTFNRGRFYINSYGLSQFPSQDYIQVLVDEDTKSIVLKPSINKKRDSFLWSGGLKKRKPRHIKCVPLFYLIFQMMEWDINARYQVRGTIEDYGEERVLFLDLRDARAFVREATPEEADKIEEVRTRPKYHMQMPQEWMKSFGMPFMDYENRQDIKTFDEMAVFDVEFAANEKKKEQARRLSEHNGEGEQPPEDRAHEESE